jgi:uncharacterized protein
VAGPLNVPVAELRRRVGSRRELRRVVDVSVVGALVGVAGTSVPPDAELALDLVVESVLEGVTVTGTITAPWRADCRRCLEPVDGAVTVDVQELFEAQPIPDETYPLEGDQIDLEPLVRDALLLSLPLSVLCDEACPGPDPERFPAAVAADEPEEPPADPRWAALGELRFEE